jgi:drug/metabolite transporter (DMT)-like permease
MNLNVSIKNHITLVFLALIWGSSYVLMKKGLVSFSPLQVAALRILISGIVLLPFLRKIEKKDFLSLTVVALLGSGIPTFIYPLAITRIDSSVAGIINSLTPVFTMLFGVLLFKTPIRAFQILGLVISLSGAILLVLLSNADKGNFEMNAFALVAILAPMFYGMSSNVLKANLNHIPALRLTASSFFIMLPFALGVLLSTDFVLILKTDKVAYQSLGYIAILAILGTALALVVFNFLIKRTSAVYASSVTFLMPIVVLFWSVLIGEKITWVHVLALLLILIGVYVLNFVKK